MKKIIILLLLLPTAFFSQKKITLEDIWAKGVFSSKYAQGFNVMNDGLNYCGIDGTGAKMVLSQFELKTGKKIKDLVVGEDIMFNNKPLNLRLMNDFKKNTFQQL